MGFGERMRELREGKGLTQEQMADRLNIARSLVVRYEQGTRWPTLLTAGEIARELGTTVDYLLKGEA